MAGMTAAEIRKFVRDSLDVETDDIPDSILNVWMNDAVTRIISYFDESPTFLQVEYSFVTSVEVQKYSLDSTVGLTDPEPLQAIDEVRGPTWSLTPRQHRQVRESYPRTAGSGNPLEFSIWGRDLYLWPKPSVEETFHVLGVRKIDTDWATAGTGVPDLPEEFHILIAHWALARAYAQQDDPEMANFYREEFAGTLTSIATRFVANTTALPMIMNGGSLRRHDPRTGVLGPLGFSIVIENA